MKTNQNPDIDLCGMKQLLLALSSHGFSEAELRKIVARIAVQIGADIILFC